MSAVTPPRAVALGQVSDLTSRDALEAIVGPIAELTVEPMRTLSSFSGSVHQRLRLIGPTGVETRLVLKRTTPAEDFTSRLSGARRSREARLLACDELAPIWAIYSCPYLAYAEDEAVAGLLMRDLSESLFPDVREPVARAHEDLLLGALGRLHARFWERDLAADWLASALDLGGLTGPERALEPGADLPPEPMRTAFLDGWTHALRVAPPPVAERLRVPAAERAAEWDRLPRTLVHGDAKVANFALPPGGAVAAFDWAMVGCAPCSVDLGWYLAVNASRLARTKEAVIQVYRALLQRELGRVLPDESWRRLEDAAVEVGARMLLWSKANALARDAPGARAEWDWWMERLG